MAYVFLSWCNSNGTEITSTSLFENSKLHLDSKTSQCFQGKQSSLQLQDQDSSSTQSTSQSHYGVAGYGQQVDGQMTLASSLGTTDLVTLPSQIDYSRLVAHIPYTYAEPYFSGVLTAFGPQAIIHPPLFGMKHGGVPLLLDHAEGPIYVNPKQYHGILRRRQARAKLQAQNNLSKGRKPYLHESRHLHAMNRVRGSGGRFIDLKKLQKSNQNDLDRALSQLRGNLLESKVIKSEDSNAGASATCSDVTSISSDNGIFGQPDLGFTSGFQSHMGGSSQSGGSNIVRNGLSTGFEASLIQ